MFNGEYGAIAKVLGAIFPFLDGVIWLATPGYAMAALVMSDVWHWFPYMTLIILGGLAAIRRRRRRRPISTARPPGRR